MHIQAVQFLKSTTTVVTFPFVVYPNHDCRYIRGIHLYNLPGREIIMNYVSPPFETMDTSMCAPVTITASGSIIDEESLKYIGIAIGVIAVGAIAWYLGSRRK